MPSSRTPSLHTEALTRRQWLRNTGLLAVSTSSLGALAAPAVSDNGAIASVTQIVDMSPLQQDIGRDFLIGSRVAWQEYNARERPKGRAIEHRVIETNGSASAIKAAWEGALADPTCVALSGCAGDAAAANVATLQRGAGSNNALPIVAPWLHRQWADVDNTIFQAFPDYQAQITHAVKSLAVMGVKQAGVVYATPALQRELGASVTLAGRSEGLEMREVPLAKRPASLPALMLFVGGTPELHAFAHQMGVPTGSHCYLVALADVNQQVHTPLGGVPRNVSVIVTQPVPLVNAGLPIVRNYRATLARLFDEPPSPHGLAGYIAARYTADVLSSLGGSVSRAAAMSAFRKRTEHELGGYRIAYQGEKLSNINVTQSMLTSDGRIVG